MASIQEDPVRPEKISEETRNNYHQVLGKLRSYLEPHIETEDQRFKGAIRENHRTIPALPTWHHAVYPAADGYVSLAAKMGDARTCAIARDMVDYLVREQSPSGCWCGYCGYLKSYGWNETNAPPGSFFDVPFPGGIVQDIIWSPFSAFGTAIYGRVVARAWRLGLAADEEQARRWRQSAQLSFEFVLRCVDDDGHTPEIQGWDQDVHIGALLALATAMTGQERFVNKAVNAVERILSHQFESGELPVIGEDVRSLHYHFFSIDALQDWAQFMPDHPLSGILAGVTRRGVGWAWKTQQKPDGNFDWSNYPGSDHKSQMFATFGLGLVAAAPEFPRYDQEVGRSLAYLAQRQHPDGGFPVHLSGETESDTCWASGTILQGLGRISTWI